MIIPIPIFDNPQFHKIWIDIFEYTVIEDERKLTENFPLSLYAMFEE